MKDDQRDYQRDHQRYLRAGHAMQSGVAVMMHHDPKNTEPKHLRVGVNMAMCDNSALAKLLVAKGLITYDELMAALADEAEAEVGRYQDEIEAATGVRPTLG